ncbi:EAL domain-containing protein [Halomonas sp.]|uniref:bifunctional diguanylate cyclase/phosphodiesterase n=1 Tax=Halomonas sp. TaxID=1486246 RepID=UPI00384DF520
MWHYTRHDRGSDPALDALTGLAAEMFDVPTVLISLVDEGCQWFKSRTGLEAAETSRDVSFCAHAILGQELFEVRDATVDERFRDNPLVTGPPYIRYYLGAPLVTPDGFSIGTLCLIDQRSRALDANQKRHLRALAEQVMRHLELQRLKSLEGSFLLAGVGTWELDVVSDTVWGNDEFYRLHGAGPLMPGNWHELLRCYLPEDRARLEAGLNAMLRDGRPLEEYLRLQRPGDAALTWVHITSVPSAGAKPVRYIAGSLQDVTLLKQKTHELECRLNIDQQINRLQSAFIGGDDIPGAFATALEGLLAYTDSEYGFIGEVFRDEHGAPFLQTHAITDISWDEASSALYEQAKDTGIRFSNLNTLFGHVLKTAEPLITNAPGRDPRRGGLPPGHPPLKALLLQPVLVEGEMIAMVGLANHGGGYNEASLGDLEPLINALGQMIQSMRLRRQHDGAWKRLKLAAEVFSSSREAITITDAANCIIEVNASFERITGYASAEVVGKNPRILASGRHEPAFYQAMWQSLKQKGYWEGEITNRRKSGELLPELLSISVVRNEAGETINHVAVFSDLTRIKQHDHELFRAGHFDLLTGMPNRQHMVELMKEAIGCCHAGDSIAVAVLDLDRFHSINARLGSEEADRVLLALARRLAKEGGPGDLVARVGGDEFALLLNRFEELPARLDGLLERLAEPLPTSDGETLRVTGSLGVTLYPADDADAEGLLRHADQAMYRAKVVGGNDFAFFDPMNEQEIKAMQLRRKNIAAALTSEEFVLYYQPQIDPHTQKIAGVEALVRWQHPERGLLMPATFLHDITGSALELAFDAWVLHEALRQQQVWLANGLAMCISINLTPLSLSDYRFVDTLRAALAAHPEVPPGLLCLEVLESSALEDFKEATHVMRDCRALGVEVALDDFGTGYSSLAYLRNLPVDVVKVDRSFVMNMLEHDADMAIVESVIFLAQRFRKRVVAEGVESEAHAQCLTAMGCDVLQGFGIARPMTVDALLAWCANRETQIHRATHILPSK